MVNLRAMSKIVLISMQQTNDFSKRFARSRNNGVGGRAWSSLAALLLVALLAGCATTGEKSEEKTYTFYPPAPATARFQYLTSFSTEKDLRGKRGGFSAFVLGEEEVSQEIIKPYGLALRDGTLYICDTIAFAIDIVDLKAGSIRHFRPQGEGRLGKPINIAVDEDGTRYVADTAWGMVLIYGADDRFLGSIGKRGETKPSDVVVRGERLYVTDLIERCVKVLDKRSHKELFRVPREGDKAESALFSPVNIAVGEDGKIYVSDFGAFNIKIYDPEGKHLQTVGQLGDHVGGMVRPKGIAVDHEGRFYMVDAATEVVQLFNAEGKLLLFFGEPSGSDVGLVLPAKVIVDYDHVDLFRKYAAPDFEVEYLVLVSSQYGPRKITVYGFGHKRGETVGDEPGA